ncbi:hypothetical protein BF30_1008 [Francisella philomiragia]|uniref:hypothetical protein n=1 Tax=Francisella philomiragia TaxID=28110 RepID=UPI0002DC892A|nr:hypothetical protein [Francisella philomiragia]AJI46920.1 hypothetical protein BF30_1008 [Francisella philomiragia]AJI48608.1 hypothetical protein KU46_547 [Francisella philomiragia]MBK2105528.1 hypothetical protein [Francisella philomiragia]
MNNKELHDLKNHFFHLKSFILYLDNCDDKDDLLEIIESMNKTISEIEDIIFNKQY